jgi:hypothetical protein
LLMLRLLARDRHGQGGGRLVLVVAGSHVDGLVWSGLVYV